MRGKKSLSPHHQKHQLRVENQEEKVGHTEIDGHCAALAGEWNNNHEKQHNAQQHLEHIQRHNNHCRLLLAAAHHLANHKQMNNRQAAENAVHKQKMGQSDTHKIGTEQSHNNVQQRYQQNPRE